MSLITNWKYLCELAKIFPDFCDTALMSIENLTKTIMTQRCPPEFCLCLGQCCPGIAAVYKMAPGLTQHCPGQRSAVAFPDRSQHD